MAAATASPALEASPEALAEQITATVRHRQELRASRAGREALELNRLELVALHGRFARALIARHLRRVA
jgi:hypothetical protein